MGAQIEATDAKQAHPSGNSSMVSPIWLQDPKETLGIIRQQSARPDNEPKNEGASAVLGELAVGAWEEFRDHPGKMAANIAIGAATGFGAALLAPEIVVAAGIAGIAYGAYKIGRHAGDWIEDAKVVAAPAGHSAAEIDSAKAGIKSLGAATMDAATSIPGSIGGSAFGIGFRAGFTGTATVAATAIGTEAVPTKTRQPISTEIPDHLKDWNGHDVAPRVPERVAARARAESSLLGTIEREFVPGQREFHIVGGNYSQITALNSNAELGTKVLTREINSDGTVGPLQKMWIQHQSPERGLNMAAASEADVIITCHPQLITNPIVRPKHVFPQAVGRIKTTLIGDNRFTVSTVPADEIPFIW